MVKGEMYSVAELGTKMVFELGIGHFQWILIKAITS